MRSNSVLPTSVSMVRAGSARSTAVMKRSEMEHGTRGKRAIYRRNEAKAKWSNALTGVRRIDGLLRGVMATRDLTRDGSSVMKRSGPSVISNAA